MIAEQRALIDTRLAVYIERQPAAIRRGRMLLAAAGVVLLVALIGVRFVLASQRRSEFARSLASVNPGQLMERLQEADEFGASLDPLLRSQVQRADKVDATAAERRAALPSRLVLVPRDQTQVPVLSEVLLGGELPYVAAIRERLQPIAEQLIAGLDMLFDAEGSTAEQQENVTLALADYAGPMASEWRGC